MNDTEKFFDEIYKLIEKLNKVPMAVIILIFLVICIGIVPVSKMVDRIDTEKDAEFLLTEINELMTYEIPEGWEFKMESAYVKGRNENHIIGDIIIGKTETQYDAYYYDCIRINVYYYHRSSEEQNRENLEINFGNTHDDYVYMKMISVDGEPAYCGRSQDNDEFTEEINLVHGKWEIHLRLLSEDEITQEQKDALYDFAESINFKK